MKLDPIRLQLPRLFDLLLVSDPEQIQWLNQHEHVTRALDPTQGILHRILHRRMRDDLGFRGELLPVFRARSDVRRVQREEELDVELRDLRGMPGKERDLISSYVCGHKEVGEIGEAVQQWCGQLFSSRYKSTLETYEAGKLLAGWMSAPPWKTIHARVSGRLNRAKAVLEAAAEHDLYCVHATSIGMENLVRTVRELRKAARDEDEQLLSADAVLREHLSVPPAVLRGCTYEVEVPFLASPITPRTLVVLLLRRAYLATGDLDVAFLSDTWSACPARKVVPEMLRAVWHAVHYDEAEAQRLMSTINSWSRLWHRAVS